MLPKKILIFFFVLVSCFGLYSTEQSIVFSWGLDLQYFSLQSINLTDNLSLSGNFNAKYNSTKIKVNFPFSFYISPNENPPIVNGSISSILVEAIQQFNLTDFISGDLIISLGLPTQAKIFQVGNKNVDITKSLVAGLGFSIQALHDPIITRLTIGGSFDLYKKDWLDSYQLLANLESTFLVNDTQGYIFAIGTSFAKQQRISNLLLGILFSTSRNKYIIPYAQISYNSILSLVSIGIKIE